MGMSELWCLDHPFYIHPKSCEEMSYVCTTFLHAHVIKHLIQQGNQHPKVNIIPKLNIILLTQTATLITLHIKIPGCCGRLYLAQILILHNKLHKGLLSISHVSAVQRQTLIIIYISLTRIGKCST